MAETPKDREAMQPRDALTVAFGIVLAHMHKMEEVPGRLAMIIAIADAIRSAENAAYELCAARIEDCPDFIAGPPIARGIRRLIRSAPP